MDVLAERMASHLPRALVVDVCRSALETARHDIAAGDHPDPEGSARTEIRALERTAGVEVINATGVLLHTNLGRAPWSETMADRARRAAVAYTNLELDIDTGERRRRGSYVERLLRRLTGAQAAFIVNNNASALLIALAATSRGKAVPVARGELIEIGGSYRLPDVIDSSGARLIEVGTTNRTRVGDYQVALQTHECGAVLKVHPSNYRVEGFTETAGTNELAELAHRQGLPLINDVGSGLLDSDASWLPDWLTGEPGVRQALDDGASLVTFSGDKLLGGPQAGILVGGDDLIEKIRSDPLARALRVDGVTYSALAATLEHHLDGEPWKIPFWSYALLEAEPLGARCGHIADRVDGIVSDGTSAVGAGSAPGIQIPTPQIRLHGRQDIYHCLLSRDSPVLTRRDAGDLIVDLRAVSPSDDDIVLAAIEQCL